MDVETLAVSELNILLAKCPHLRAYITVNDKTPFTDGHVDIYEGLILDKEHWRGRVPVQVKGRTRFGKPKQSMQFSVSRVDLAAFQRDSGVLYFVAAVDGTSGVGTVYYLNLSPAAIEWKLQSAATDQANLAFSFSRLPDDPVQVERIVAMALKTRDQKVSLGFDSSLFEKLQSITLHSAQDLDLSNPVTLTPGDSDFAVEMKTAGGMTVPLVGELRIFPSSYLDHVVEMPLSSGGVTYDAPTVKQLSESETEVKLGDGLAMTLRERPEGITGSINLTLGGKLLRERIKAIVFYLALVETESLTVGSAETRFQASGHTHDDELRSHLKALRELQEILEVLRIDPDVLDISHIDDSQHPGIRALLKTLVRGEEIVDSSLSTSRALIDLAQWKIMVIVLPGTRSGSWRVIDPFDPSTRQEFRLSTGDSPEADDTVVTAYDGIEIETLVSVINLRLEGISEAYEFIRDHPTTAALANQQVLSLIGAADEQAARREEFLAAAAALADWLVLSFGPEPIYLVNQWQVQWRRQSLSISTRGEIRSMRRRAASGEMENATEIEVACALLLGDREEADELVGRLDEKRLAALQSWPIWKLHDSIE